MRRTLPSSIWPGTVRPPALHGPWHTHCIRAPVMTRWIAFTLVVVMAGTRAIGQAAGPIDEGTHLSVSGGTGQYEDEATFKRKTGYYDPFPFCLVGLALGDKHACDLQPIYKVWTYAYQVQHQDLAMSIRHRFTGSPWRFGFDLAATSASISDSRLVSGDGNDDGSKLEKECFAGALRAGYQDAYAGAEAGVTARTAPILSLNGKAKAAFAGSLWVGPFYGASLFLCGSDEPPSAIFGTTEAGLTWGSSRFHASVSRILDTSAGRDSGGGKVSADVRLLATVRLGAGVRWANRSQPGLFGRQGAVFARVTYDIVRPAATARPAVPFRPKWSR